MFFVKNSLLFLSLFVFVFANSWVLEYKNKVFYESDFYAFFPKDDWNKIKKDQHKRASIFSDFVRQVAAVYEANALGLHRKPSVSEKLNGRFDRLLVNEYYMREFLGSVIPDNALSFCKQNLKKTVFVNHILIKKEKKAFALSLLDSLAAGVDFSSLAFSFSEDPSAKQNNGTLGWVTVGQAVPDFQNLVFGLCVGCVGFVETDFGFHVVKVDSVKKSSYAGLDKQEYNDFAFRFATGYIKEPLRLLAAKHDSLLLLSCGVSFDFVVLNSFVDVVREKTLASKNKSRENVDFLGLLEEVGGVARYKGDVLSGRWFVNKFLGPFYKNVFFDSVDGLLGELRLVLLRDFVRDLSLKKGVDQGFSFKKQFSSVKNEILKKEYLKFLVNSVVSPTKEEIEFFYFDNEKELFTNKKTGKPFGLVSAYGSVEAILLKEKQEAATERFFVAVSREAKINEGWLF